MSDVRVFGAYAFHRAKDVVHRLHWSGVVGAGGRRKHVSLPVCNIRAEYFNVDLIGSIRCSKASSSSPSLERRPDLHRRMAAVTMPGTGGAAISKVTKPYLWVGKLRVAWIERIMVYRRKNVELTVAPVPSSSFTPPSDVTLPSGRLRRSSNPLFPT